MRILIDASIYRGREVFSRLGEVQTFEGRRLEAARLADAQALIVRSVTPVSAGLLEGSRVRFVGTTSTGHDHIEVDRLTRRGVAFASAAGCNARTVAEYVLAGLLEISRRRGVGLERMTLGVAGVGRIGRIVSDWARFLGMTVLCSDPPRADAEGRKDFLPLDELLSRCDVVTLHVPLSQEGPHATWWMLDARRLEQCNKDGVYLINTSRGDVADEAALVASARAGRITGLVLDVWQNEPDVSRELLEAATIATPHLAGYSLRARARATEQVYRDMAGFLGESNKSIKDIDWSYPPPATVAWPADGRSLTESLRGVLPACFDLIGADQAMRAGMQGVNRFDALRGQYADRREFGDFRVTGVGGETPEGEILTKLGFMVR